MRTNKPLAYRLEAFPLLWSEVDETELGSREDLRMLADQVLDQILRLLIERIICSRHVGKFGVSSLRGDRACVQQRIFGGHDFERAVGMPKPIANGEQTTPVIARKRLVVPVEVRNVSKRGRQAIVLRFAEAGTDRKLDRAEALRKRQLLLVV